MTHQSNASTASSFSRISRTCARAVGTFALAAALVTSVAALSIVQARAQSTGGQSTAPRAQSSNTRVVKPSGPSKSTSRMKTMTPTRVIVVFPTDAKGGVSDQVSDIITETIQGRVAASGRYQTVYFLRSIPTVARALNEATLTPNEVSHPFDDDTKLKKLMPYTGFDMALTTSIDSYTYDAAKNQVTMLISARLIDFRGEKPVVRAAAENDKSSENAGNAREIVLASQVAKSITEKLMNTLLGQAAPMMAPAGSKK